jgi:hypothetical protein
MQAIDRQSRAGHTRGQPIDPKTGKLTESLFENAVVTGLHAMSKLVWTTLVVASTLWTWPTAAQTFEAGRAKEWFVEHDRNHDGYVTLDEVMGYETKLFNRMDDKQTGRLREDQYCAGIPSYNLAEQKRCHSRFAQIDADNDGYINLEEIRDFYRLTLQTADQRGDGRITLEEWLAVAVGD